MSYSHSAGVFFGAYFDREGRDSDAAEKLEAYIERCGGEPAPTDVPGIVVRTVGDCMQGRTWLAVCVEDSELNYDRGDTVGEPVKLCERAEWVGRIAMFLDRIGAEPPVNRIGWHFYGLVS